MQTPEEDGTKKLKPWEVSVKNGVLTCMIDLSVPDAITMGLGVAERIKGLLITIEDRKNMEKKMREMQSKIIVPGILDPNGRGAA